MISCTEKKKEKKMPSENRYQIPRVIHYFWFGGGEKSESVKKCIESWKDKCPDFGIKEWNESNYDIYKNAFMENAYTQKMWAFVTDFARLDVLFQYGGIYLDTDVEVLKDLSPLCKYRAFMGFENDESVADGLGFGFVPGHHIVREMMDYYLEDQGEEGGNGQKEFIESPRLRTEVLVRHGLKQDGTRQSVEDVEILPSDYLCPLDSATGRLNITENTYSIHHFDASWHGEGAKRAQALLWRINRIFGKKLGMKIFGGIMTFKDVIKPAYHNTRDWIDYFVRSLLRRGQNKENRRRLTNKDFSVFSSNCVGAFILHELGQRFNSPTVNLYFEPADYIRFLKNLDHYLSCTIEEDSYESAKMGYPVGYCDDIKLHLVHYKSIEEANEKWKQRSERVNKDNLFVIMTERDGCTSEIRREFDALPYKNKAFLSYRDNADISCNVKIPGTEERTQDGFQTRDLCSYQDGFTGLRLFDRWDYVEFFNGEGGNNRFI